MNEKQPLLTITLSDIDSNPVVHYKGKQIDRKLRVGFDWASDTDKVCYMNYIHIEHVDVDKKRCNSTVIQHNQPIVIKD
ncbi:hypothetical protein CN923_27165 [Bacillus cereus]|nr:hypothetical protein IC7_01584 [Bacillus cereus BAG1O-1]PDY24007.1 hypothetical protein COM83_10705 [Bacillus cereus]PEA25241.1 hypothetical protein CON44_21830 [Bacillus cereus]PEQ26580.1 hypothetical protein CN467_30735 [Bacillus cereus]PER18208.1 hypothetical protein CN485_28025 [Bacillus cereus]